MGFADEVGQASREMGGGGDWYKFKEGDNKMRIMSEPLIKVSRFGYGICYEGAPYCQKATLDRELEEAKAKARAAGKSEKEVDKVTIKMPSQKWSCWAIIRAKEGEDTLALVDLPYGVSKDLLELMNSDEARFTEWPMPYDINIKAKGAGSLKVEYTLIADRQNKPVTQEELDEFAKKSPVVQILDRMKAKKKAEVEGTSTQASAPVEYPDADSEGINPDDIPF